MGVIIKAIWCSIVNSNICNTRSRFSMRWQWQQKVQHHLRHRNYNKSLDMYSKVQTKTHSFDGTERTCDLSSTSFNNIVKIVTGNREEGNASSLQQVSNTTASLHPGQLYPHLFSLLPPPVCHFTTGPFINSWLHLGYYSMSMSQKSLIIKKVLIVLGKIYQREEGLKKISKIKFSYFNNK